MAPKGGVAPGAAGSGPNRSVYKDKIKPTDIRLSNINAAKAIADAIRTSLGPRGMDKMIQAGNGEVTITNDGATILKQMNVIHPAAEMLVELSRAQDIEAGDGTTSVVVIAGALLNAVEKLLGKGIHPSVISDAFQRAVHQSVKILEEISTPVEMNDEDSLVQSAATSLCSKVVSQHVNLLAPIAVKAVLAVTEQLNSPLGGMTCDLKDIRVLQRLGGTLEDSELVKGLVLAQKTANVSGPKKVERPLIGLIQFCISPPKTDMDHNVIVSDYAAMDRILKEEREYILNIVKKIKASKCNVLLVQKSILRDALSDLAVHFLDKIKVMVVKDIEREDIEFVCKTLGCRPIASLDHFTTENLVKAELAEEVSEPSGKFVKITGIANPGRTVTVICRGSNRLMLAEAERSLHDALCCVRCLVRKPALLPGGGAGEAQVALRLSAAAQSALGADHYCLRAFAEALTVIPSTLAENAGLSPINIVTELHAAHAAGQKNAGISVRRGCVADMVEERVLQPLLVSVSALTLATETVRSILKIDDIVNTFS